MLTSRDIANYFISLTSEDQGDFITNLKVQKLVYYAQGYNLALYDEPLFNENIEAWRYGPVVPELYHQLKGYENQALPMPMGLNFKMYTKQTKDLLNEIHEVLGQYSAWKLAQITHQEKPWIDAAPNKEVITHEALKSFFLTQIND